MERMIVKENNFMNKKLSSYILDVDTFREWEDSPNIIKFFIRNKTDGFEENKFINF